MNVIELVNCLPEHARKHFINLRNVRQERLVQEYQAKLRENRAQRAARGVVMSGTALLEEFKVAEQLHDRMAEGFVEDALATCRLYDIPLTQALCECFLSATEEFLRIKYKQDAANRARGLAQSPIPPSAREQLANAGIQHQFRVMSQARIVIETARVEDERKRIAVGKKLEETVNTSDKQSIGVDHVDRGSVNAPLAGRVSPPPQKEPSKRKQNFDRFIAVLAFLAAPLLFVLQSNGIEINWVLSLSLYILVCAGGAWTCWRHAVPHLQAQQRFGITALLVIVIAVLGYLGTKKQYAREHPAKAAFAPPNSTENKPSPVLQSPPSKPVHAIQSRLAHKSATDETHLTSPIALSAVIANPASPMIAIVNQSDRVAENVTWELILFRASDDGYFSFITQSIGYIKPLAQSANYDMNLPRILGVSDGTDGPLKPGDDLTGSLIIDCPQCQAKTYIVHFDWQNAGWFYGSDFKGIIVPKDMKTKEGRASYIATLMNEATTHGAIKINPLDGP